MELISHRILGCKKRKRGEELTPRERCIRVALALWRICENEWKAEVLGAIQKDIDRLATEIRRNPDADVAPLHLRRQAVRALRKHDHPFSSSALQQLTIAVVQKTLRVAAGLPTSEAISTMTRLTFVKGLLSSCVWTDGRPTAPFSRTSFAFVTLKRVCALLPTLIESEFDSDKDSKTFVENILVEALSRSKIDYMRWYDTATNRHAGTWAGRVPSDFVYIHIAAPASHAAAAEDNPFASHAIITSEDIVIESSRSATRRAIMADPGAEWMASQFSLRELVQYADKNCPPTEFNLSAAGVNDTRTMEQSPELYADYKWVADNFKMSHPLHRLAVFVAIVFTRLIPCHFFVEGQRLPEDLRSTDPKVIRDHLLRMDLEESRSTQGGRKARGPFIAIVTTIAVTMWDERSPMRRRFKAGTKGLGNKWNTKHREFLLVDVTCFIILICLFVNFYSSVLGNKGLTSPILSLLRIYDPTPRVFDWPPKLGTSHNVPLKSDLEALSKQFFATLCDQRNRFAVFCAVSLIIGEKHAARLAEEGEYPVPPGVAH